MSFIKYLKTLNRKVKKFDKITPKGNMTNPFINKKSDKPITLTIVWIEDERNIQN